MQYFEYFHSPVPVTDIIAVTCLCCQVNSFCPVDEYNLTALGPSDFVDFEIVTLVKEGF